MRINVSFNTASILKRTMLRGMLIHAAPRSITEIIMIFKKYNRESLLDALDLLIFRMDSLYGFYLLLPYTMPDLFEINKNEVNKNGG